jgi:hypothetical protein
MLKCLTRMCNYDIVGGRLRQIAFLGIASICRSVSVINNAVLFFTQVDKLAEVITRMIGSVDDDI